MINYTERISLLMRDLVSRVPQLAYIDPDELLVFARYGRSGADGAFATCHCICLPPTDPGYYYWKDRQTGIMTRRSRWFVTKSPSVQVGGTPIQYLISFTLPRFCDQTLQRSRKEQYYGQVPPWVAKLDTIVHELYHIDPACAGIRRVDRADGGPSSNSHGRGFFETVAAMTMEYLASKPDPETYDFLRYSFRDLEERFEGVLGTTFRAFPSYPQRYMEVLPPSTQPAVPVAMHIQPLRTPAGPTSFTESDLVARQFLSGTTRRVPRRDPGRVWSVMRQVSAGAGIQRAAAGHRRK